MATKKDASQTPMKFCNEFGVPDALTIDGAECSRHRVHEELPKE
jgi:hypothetical protein